MNPITLKNQTPEGIPLEVKFLPEKGMNMISYKLENIEVIDQSTQEGFKKRFAGLGALIGPRFHCRKSSIIPHIEGIAKFLDIPEGRSDPFSHGIGRYSAWKAEATEHSVHATLSGKDTWHDAISLSDIEGQNFKMSFKANLTPCGLQLELAVVSDTDSIVGIHYYYYLPEGKNTIISKVQDAYIVNNEKKPLPADWNFNSQSILRYELNKDTDFTFFPYPNPLEGEITLETETHRLVTNYWSASQENSWQLWHPKEASFVCIEPVSSQDPRHPNLTVSSIKIQLQISKI